MEINLCALKIFHVYKFSLIKSQSSGRYLSKFYKAFYKYRISIIPSPLMSTNENELNELNRNSPDDPSSLNSNKLLLTQEFNNNPSTNVYYSNRNSFTSQSSGYSLPFVIGQDFNNGPSFMAPPQAFILQPITTQYKQALQNQFMNMPQLSNKKAKMEGGGGLIEELASFKSTLRASFERNLQKLEVLDRMVQTVTLKGNFKIEAVKSVLGLLSSARAICQDLANDQITFTAETISELRSTLTSEISAHLKSISMSDSSSKIEIIEKLRKEEDSHLTDLTILSSRNKELQSGQKALKEQLERLQAEFQESCRRLAGERDDFKNVIETVSGLLNVPEDAFIDGIEDLQKQLQLSKNELTTTNISMINFIRSHLIVIEDIRTDFKELSSDQNNNDGSFLHRSFVDLIEFICEEMGAAYEDIFCARERFYNSTLNSLNLRIENLVEAQDLLVRKALRATTSLQGQLGDALESKARLRKQLQELNERFESAASTVERFQFREMDSAKKNEILTEKLRALEHELSMKNQENRAFSIRIQGLQEELEETKNRHRHDICALERKITVLEAKNNNNTTTTKNISNKDPKQEEMKMIEESDPFSSNNTIVTTASAFVRGDGYNQSNLGVNAYPIEEATTVPPSIAAKNPKFVITFTGIRNGPKQKELKSWLEELGAQVHSGPDFHDDISHVLAPKGHKSIRVLAASLTGKWIVPVDWVEACKKSGHFVPEASHGGFCNSSVRPFRLRSLWMSAAFAATHKAHPLYPTAALRTLLEKLGKARWREMASQADFLLVTDEEMESKLIGSAKGTLLTLNNLINMIPVE